MCWGAPVCRCILFLFRWRLVSGCCVPGAVCRRLPLPPPFRRGMQRSRWCLPLFLLVCFSDAACRVSALRLPAASLRSPCASVHPPGRSLHPPCASADSVPCCSAFPLCCQVSFSFVPWLCPAGIRPGSVVSFLLPGLRFL